MHREGKLYIGTSGWMYKDWGKEFYPEDMKKGFLTFLANEFNTVEINNSFYRLPTLETFKKWHSETPDRFIFAVKLSRYITHIRRLKDVRQGLERFLNNAVGLEKKLGVILIQLPPNLRFDEDLLGNFFEDLNVLSESLPLRPKFALEPRSKSFMENSDLLKKMIKKQKISLAFPHSLSIPSFAPDDENLTANFVYLRFHGPAEFAASRYGEEGLMPWAERIVHWLDKGLTVFAYFNNDVHGHAVHDARTLKECCKKLQEEKVLH